MRLKFSQNCPCIGSIFQNFLTLCRKKSVLTFLVEFITVKLFNHRVSKCENSAVCCQHSWFICPYSYLKKNDGLVIWESKFSPSLQVAGKIQGQCMTRKANAGGSLLFSESWDHMEHCQLSTGGGSPQRLTRPNRTEQTYRNQKESPKSPPENGKKPEVIGSLKLGNLCQVQTFYRLLAVLEPEVINIRIKHV